MAKNGWKLSKVAIGYYREYPVTFGQKREIVGVGQSDTASNRGMLRRSRCALVFKEKSERT